MFKSITLGELKEIIEDAEKFGDSLETLVTFSSDYGDHCYTRQVHALHGMLEEHLIEESGYAESGYAIVKQEFQKLDKKEYQKVLVII